MKVLKLITIGLTTGLIFTSCAIKKSQFNEINLKEKYCQNLTYCAIGIGKSKEEAQNDAKRNLASQIYSFVFSDFEKKTYLNTNTEKQELKESKESILKTFTNISLVNVKNVKSGKIDGYYYYIAAIDPQKAQEIYNQYKQTITALTYVDKIESENDLSAVIGLLKDLMQEIKIKNIEDKDFYSRKYSKIFSFKSYINFQIKQVINSLNAILSPKGIWIVDKNTLSPLSNIRILILDNVNNKILDTTNYQGFIRFPSPVNFPINVYLDFKGFDLEDLLIAKLYKKENPYIKIYIKTHPDNLYFNLIENSRVIKEGMTPSVVEIKYQDYADYKLKMFEDDYVLTEEELKLSRGYDYYLYKQVDKLRYGYLDLKAEGDSYLIIKSQSGLVLLDKRYKKKKFKGKVPVGTYYITVKKKNNSHKYQVVNDEIFVREGQTVRRTYFEPKYREYYFEREGTGFGFIYSRRSTNKDINYECISSWGCDYHTKPDFSPGGTGGFYYKRFLTRVWWGIEVGFGGIDNENEEYSGDSSGVYLDLGSGLYFGENTIFEIGVGYHANTSDYNDGIYKADFSASGPYVSAKIGYFFQGKRKDGGFYIGLGYKRVFLGGKDYLEILSFDFGGYIFKTRSGYKLPSNTRALRGINYEED
ncbi:LPP20 family lipoprotein [Persephonella sp.]